MNRAAHVAVALMLAASAGCSDSSTSSASPAASTPSTATSPATIAPSANPWPTADAVQGDLPRLGVLEELLPRAGALGAPTPEATRRACGGFTVTGPLFAPNQGSLAPNAAAAVEALADRLNAMAGTIEITGHTDARPARNYEGGNAALSADRALSVADALRTRLTDPARITLVQGRAALDLVDTSTTEAGYARNRRVEVAVRCTQ